MVSGVAATIDCMEKIALAAPPKTFTDDADRSRHDIAGPPWPARPLAGASGYNAATFCTVLRNERQTASSFPYAKTTCSGFLARLRYASQPCAINPSASETLQKDRSYHAVRRKLPGGIVR